MHWKPLLCLWFVVVTSPPSLPPSRHHYSVKTTNIFHANLSVGHGHLVQETTNYENMRGKAFI